jgi:hypothetical protein
MSAVNTIKYSSSPSRRRGECYLRDRDLVVFPKTLRNTETIKRKARANKLEEEYRRKYLRERNPPVVIQQPQGTPALGALVVVPIIQPAYSESALYTATKRTLTFCIKLLLYFLITIAICILIGHSLRYLDIVYRKNDEL